METIAPGPPRVQAPRYPAAQRGAVRFTFYWSASRRWEGGDFAVAVQAP